MKQIPTNILVTLSAILITFLFHDQDYGLNLLLFEFFILTIFALTKRLHFKHFLSTLSTAGLLSTAIFTVITYSDFVYFTNIVSLVLFIGVHLHPEIKSILHATGLTLNNLFKAQAIYFKKISKAEGPKRMPSLSLRRLRIYIIPIIIIALFLAIYRNSNPIFDQLASHAFIFINKLYASLFGNIEFAMLLTFFMGLIISNAIFQQTTNDRITQKDLLSTDLLIRRRKNIKGSINTIGLKNELRSAVFLFFTLNVLLIALNLIDIYSVWFNFSWGNSTLKDFVHEGTYYLLFSILLSILLVLYFFRHNLNFFGKNKFLKILCYIWLAQNAILTISVVIRNFWYVHYFSLAYKRIGLFIFLILTLIGLLTVLLKIKGKKSSFYLIRVNALSLYCTLTLCSFVDWDTLIAKYNVSHSTNSYYHFSYNAELSDKTLPIINLSKKELQNIEAYHEKEYSFESSSISRSVYIGKENYADRIDTRIADFKGKWENKNLLEWNLPEYLAYKKLMDN